MDEDVRLCSKCGKPLPPKSKYCPACGTFNTMVGRQSLDDRILQRAEELKKQKELEALEKRNREVVRETESQVRQKPVPLASDSIQKTNAVVDEVAVDTINVKKNEIVDVGVIPLRDTSIKESKKDIVDVKIDTGVNENTLPVWEKHEGDGKPIWEKEIDTFFSLNPSRFRTAGVNGNRESSVKADTPSINQPLYEEVDLFFGNSKTSGKAKVEGETRTGKYNYKSKEYVRNQLELPQHGETNNPAKVIGTIVMSIFLICMFCLVITGLGSFSPIGLIMVFVVLIIFSPIAIININKRRNSNKKPEDNLSALLAKDKYDQLEIYYADNYARSCIPLNLYKLCLITYDLQRNNDKTKKLIYEYCIGHPDYDYKKSKFNRMIVDLDLGKDIDEGRRLKGSGKSSH